MFRTYRITLELNERLYDDTPPLDPAEVKHELESILDLHWPGDDLRVASIVLLEP